MSKKKELNLTGRQTPSEHLAQRVNVVLARRLAAQQKESVWSGLGFMGMIGWTLSLPVLLGVLLGRWLDSHSPGSYLWTLSLLLLGLVIGVANAWHWVVKTGWIDDKGSGKS
ncbi:MAG: AtpZ/AtpI family protein [Betaproteobacteria bacterium]|nr:AtpZ/AtpI family protein [Betaproteobacteria bacterium]